jgi:hypothetical protein
MKRVFLLYALFIISLYPSTIFSQWIAKGVPICDTIKNIGTYLIPQIVEDGEGGAIICWRDIRSWQDLDIYAQRIDSKGFTQWQKNGIPICLAPLNQDYPIMISDNEGGAIIAWEDDRDTVNSKIYVQKVSHNGNILWNNNGVLAGKQGGLFARPVLDGEGGVIVAWWSRNTSGDHDMVFCQRIDKDGNIMWGDSGIIINERPGVIPNNEIAIISDGNNGAIIAWTQEEVIYAQRIAKEGKILWKNNGITICNEYYVRGAVSCITDNEGGGYIVWADRRQLVTIYAQHLDSNGSNLWQSNGMPIQIGGSPQTITDYNGGFLVFFENGDGDLFLQRVNKFGELLFDTTSVKFFKDTIRLNNESHNLINYDKNGGAIVTWQYVLPYNNILIYAQAVDGKGKILWNNGQPSVVDSLDIRYPKSCSDGNGGAIVVWHDFRSYLDSTNRHIALYAQHLNNKGNITNVTHEKSTKPTDNLYLYQNYPNPFNPETIIRYELKNSGNVKIIITDILGREVRKLIDEYQKSGMHQVIWDGNSDCSKLVSSGTYFYQVQLNNSIIIKKMVFLH